jgi:hypothetical protein
VSGLTNSERQRLRGSRRLAAARRARSAGRRSGLRVWRRRISSSWRSTRISSSLNSCERKRSKISAKIVLRVR